MIDVLIASRKIKWNQRYQKNGTWRRGETNVNKDLGGKKGRSLLL